MTKITEILNSLLKLFFTKPEQPTKPDEPLNTETQSQSESKEYTEFDIDLLRKMLIYDEGEVLNIYKDSLGYYTIGIGHLLTKSANYSDALHQLNLEVKRTTNGTITKKESADLFEKDLKDVIKGVKSNVLLKEVYESLDPIRRLALLNMVFQMGVNGVANFKNSMKMAKEKRWSDLEKNLKLSLWYKQTPNRANRVILLFSYTENKYPV